MSSRRNPGDELGLYPVGTGPTAATSANGVVTVPTMVTCTVLLSDGFPESERACIGPSVGNPMFLPYSVTATSPGFDGRRPETRVALRASRGEVASVSMTVPHVDVNPPDVVSCVAANTKPSWWASSAATPACSLTSAAVGGFDVVTARPAAGIGAPGFSADTVTRPPSPSTARARSSSGLISNVEMKASIVASAMTGSRMSSAASAERPL